MELTTGALLLKQHKAGDRIVILHMTLGEGGNPKMSPAAYGAQKRREALAVDSALGAESIFAPYRDGELPDDEAVRLYVANVIRQVKPTHIFTHWKKSIHKDHSRTSAIVQDAVDLVQGDAVIRNIHLATQLTSTPLHVLGDRVQLAQALLNLIANAMDAVAAVEPSQRVVTVTTEAAYEAALVVVRDTGPGLGNVPEILFEPFFTTKPSGMGMGLPIARTIVEAHGGRAWAANIAGSAGASAYVSLPLEAPASS